MIRALVVDDGRAVRQLVGRTLRLLYDADVIEAANNHDALEALRSRSVDLVITDIVRAGGSGLDLIREMASDPRLKDLPVIVQSGSITDHQAELSKLNPAVLLPKPFGSAELAAAIDRLRPGPPLRSIEAMQIELGHESSALDFKAVLPLRSKDARAALAKDVIAMANSGGGRIVVGVAETEPGLFKPVGVTASEAAPLEVSKLNKALASFMDPVVSVRARRVEHDGKTFIFIEVPDAGGDLVLAARQNDAASLFPGRLYVRTGAAETCEIQRADEVRALVERIVLFRLRRARQDASV